VVWTFSFMTSFLPFSFMITSPGISSFQGVLTGTTTMDFLRGDVPTGNALSCLASAIVPCAVPVRDFRFLCDTVLTPASPELVP